MRMNMTDPSAVERHAAAGHCGSECDSESVRRECHNIYDPVRRRPLSSSNGESKAGRRGGDTPGPRQHNNFPTELEEVLRQAHKMETLGMIAESFGRRFNNLLQGVVSAINLVRDGRSTSGARDPDFLIAHAFEAIHEVKSLTQRLTEFSRPRAAAARCVDVNAVISGIEDMLKYASEPWLRLRFELGAEPMWTLCDPHQLEGTLLGLALNARAAMPLGGTLTIRTEHAELAADLNELPMGRYVSICVEDTGSGMCSETLTRVFDPFYTTKTTGHGMGWGLPLTALFVEQFRGHVAIDSAPGAGTQVWLHLPSDEI